MVHAVGLNGQRGAWLEPATAVPTGWSADRCPPLHALTNIVLGEMSARSTDPHSGIYYKGQYLGFTEVGTIGPAVVRTGLAHLQVLSITPVHLLPTNDFASVDESGMVKPYTWGYEPLHYTMPEGSFTTDAANPTGRCVCASTASWCRRYTGTACAWCSMWCTTIRSPCSAPASSNSARLLLPPQCPR